MSEAERCPECGVSYERVIHHIIDGVPCYDLRLRSLQAERDLLAAEVETWRALYWHSYESGQPLVCCNYQEQHCVEVTSIVEQETWRGTGDSPQAATVDLATKLGLLPAPTGKEKT